MTSLKSTVLLWTIMLIGASLIPTQLAYTQSTAFSYQGYLRDGGEPANGLYDFQFKLYDAAVAGSQVGVTATFDDLSVANGLFTVLLDYGGNAFFADRWLQIEARPGASMAAHTVLTPRVKITPTPQALYAYVAGSLILPFSATVNNPADLFSVTQTGTGGSGFFRVNNAANAGNALFAQTNGAGNAFAARTSGTGNAGFFRNTNAANGSATLYSQTNGSGAAIVGGTNGTGSAGFFDQTNVLNFSAALTAQTNGLGPAVRGIALGASTAGAFESASGRALVAQITLAGNASNTLEVSTVGTGRGGLISLTNAGNASDGLEVYTAGTGRGGWFRLINPANASDGLEVITDGTGRAGFFRTTNAANASTTLEARSTSTVDGTYTIMGLSTGLTGNTRAIYGNNMSSSTGATAVEGWATDASPNRIFGVKGASNSLNDGGAGVQAIGNGVAGPGIPQAAALEIFDGAIRVNGDQRPAGTLEADIDWVPIRSCITPCPDCPHDHIIGWRGCIELRNDLIIPGPPNIGSIIQATVEAETHCQMCVYVQVYNKRAGRVCFCLTSVGCQRPPARMWVHYVIINPEPRAPDMGFPCGGP